MKKRMLQMPRFYPREEARRRAHQFLPEIQKKLLPEHASDLVAINVETGEYVVGSNLMDTTRAFKKRWPDVLPYTMRVNGRPVIKFHGK